MNYQAELATLETPEFYNVLRNTSREYNFTKSEYSIAECVFNFMRKYGRAFPSVNTIAENARCSVRTVQRALKKFELIGIISRSARFAKNHRQTSNEFTLETRVTKCHPLQSSRVNKVTKISIRDLYNKLIKKRSIEKALTGRFVAIADDITQGSKKAEELLTGWVFYWKERHPNSVFSLAVWEKWFRGWVNNSFNMAVYA